MLYKSRTPKAQSGDMIFGNTSRFNVEKLTLVFLVLHRDWDMLLLEERSDLLPDPLHAFWILCPARHMTPDALDDNHAVT